MKYFFSETPNMPEIPMKVPSYSTSRVLAVLHVGSALYWSIGRL